MIEELISIARIYKPFGLKGLAKASGAGDTLSSLKIPCLVSVSDNHNSCQHKLVKVVKRKTDYLIGFENISTYEQISVLCGNIILIRKADLPPKKNDHEFYHFELIGLRPVSGTKDLSEFQITGILDNPAHEILQFSDGTNEILVPFMGKFVGEINPDLKTIEIFDWESWIVD
ncbi:MAG: ribosome maturation factor RimM [Leptospira sp.]|nr:ribosome maturation factor RimM [Leptospira sp.]